jgi:MoxR-like ATPase
MVKNNSKSEVNMNLNANHYRFLDAAAEQFPNQVEFSKSTVKKICATAGIPKPSWLFRNPQFKAGYGTYSIESVVPENYSNPAPAVQAVQTVEIPTSTVGVNVLDENISVIPSVMDNYVPFGHFKDLKSILKSGIFFPVFITGLSGNGKTLMVEQICAKLKKELFRVNITIETDEDDLIGSNTLINGNIVFKEGPVLKAMRKGAVLLLDEVDLASNKIMCLQSILEGGGYLIKKTGEFVKPEPGFTVVATANTKGKGSEDGRFIGTNILNEAFLERFAICLEQEYPPVTTEKKIVKGDFAILGVNDDEFANKLVDWADVIRKSFYEGAVDEVISTRRLVHIAKAFSMFNDKLKSIEVCLARFDEDTKASFLDLYTKVDEGVNPLGDEVNEENANDELDI